MNETATQRSLRLFEYYLNGDTLQTIGDREGLTRERIRQLLALIPQYHEFRETRKPVVEKVPCPVCKEEFYKLRTLNKKTCSRKCFVGLQAQHWTEKAKIRMSAKEKVCTKCKEIKSVSEFFVIKKFGTSKRRHPSYTSSCKKCHYIAVKKWHKNNPEKKRAMDKRAMIKYAKLHPEIMKQRQREYLARIMADPVRYEAMKKKWSERYHKNKNK